MAQYSNLFKAIRSNDPEEFYSLLECITWPRTTDFLDVDLLNEALDFGQKDIVEHLLDNKCRLSKPSADVQPLHLALLQPDFTDIVKRLLALGARVSEVNDEGDNAVHLAFIKGVPGRTIDMLLLKYLDETNENFKNADGLSVLHVACTRPNLFVMKKLIGGRENDEEFVKNEVNCQVDPTCECNFAGYTPLHFAVSYGRKEIMKFLVTKLNADAYVQDANHSTPLHLALERRDIHAIDLIMAYNFPIVAYKDYVNSYGLSHFMAACVCNIQDIAVKFMQVASSRSTESLQVLVNRQVNLVHEIVDPPFAGYSPMHFAAEFGQTNTVQQLAHHGASFFIKSAEDCSPLVVAVKHGHDEIARLLFWCYKQYRRTIFDDEGDDTGGDKSAIRSDYWDTCVTNFNGLKI